jgi:peptidoglycan-N-acetylglucosamine deacetylase
MKNILTVDVEDWFHICGVDDLIPEKSWPDLESRVEAGTQKILDLLSAKQVKATFFVLGYIAEQHPGLVRRIFSAGHEIATHGFAHRLVYTMTPDEFRQDLAQSVAVISAITGAPIAGFRAPEWSIRDDSLWALNILMEEGFLYDSSMAPLPIIGNQNYARFPLCLRSYHGQLWELPPLTADFPLLKMPLGGGWGLRTFPYACISSAIRTLNSQGHPALVYLHPREFDDGCPRIKLPVIKQLVLRGGLTRTQERLSLLLDDFEFAPVASFLENKAVS